MALIDAGYVETEPNTAHVMEEVCAGCKTCIPMCPYHAISFMLDIHKSRINEALCKGCGTCVAACPAGAIKQNLFDDDEIFEEIEGILTNA